MRMLVDAIEAGAFGEIRHLLHIGIGGSALGPDLLVDALGRHDRRYDVARSEEHTSELQSLMRISYAVFCLNKKKTSSLHILTTNNNNPPPQIISQPSTPYTDTSIST